MGQNGKISLIAVTGGIGSGKSSVAACLCEVTGAVGISADAVCRNLLEPGGVGWLALRREYGERFFGDDGVVNRPMLRNGLFGDMALRRTVEGLIHPLIRAEIVEMICRLSRMHDGCPLRFVVEVPLLYEAGWQDDFSQVVAVYASRRQCVQRLMARDSISEDEAQQAMAAQMPLHDKVLLAEHVIDNSGPWSVTFLQVLHLGGLLWPGGKFCLERPRLTKNVDSGGISQ